MWEEPNTTSLCHPLYFSTARTDLGPPIPAYPEIRAGVDGVCLSHLHWVGVNSKIYVSGHQQHSQLILLHEEQGHWFLSGALLSDTIRLNLLHLWAEIYRLGRGEGRIVVNGQIEKRNLKTPVHVPLATTEHSPLLALEWLWGHIRDLTILSNPVEEVYAVWCSLDAGEKAGLLSTRRKKVLEHEYKKKYGAFIDGFAALYDNFKGIAQNVNPIVAFSIAFWALMSLSPEAALRDMIEITRQFLPSGKPLDDLDILESLFVPIVVQYCSAWDRDYLQAIFGKEGDGNFMDPEFLPLWKERPEKPLYFSFDYNGIRFESKAFNQQSFFELLWLEAICQQLTTGLGLICPFWQPGAWPEGRCCNKERRFWLEGIWKYTRGSRETWQPQGCLKPLQVR